MLNYRKSRGARIDRRWPRTRKPITPLRPSRGRTPAEALMWPRAACCRRNPLPTGKMVGKETKRKKKKEKKEPENEIAIRLANNGLIDKDKARGIIKKKSSKKKKKI